MWVGKGVAMGFEGDWVEEDIAPVPVQITIWSGGIDD